MMRLTNSLRPEAVYWYIVISFFHFSPIVLESFYIHHISEWEGVGSAEACP